MKANNNSKSKKEKSKLGKHLIALFIMVTLGYIVGYLIDTQNSTLYGVLIGASLVEAWVVIDAAFSKNK